MQGLWTLIRDWKLVADDTHADDWESMTAAVNVSTYVDGELQRRNAYSLASAVASADIFQIIDVYDQFETQRAFCMTQAGTIIEVSL